MSNYLEHANIRVHSIDEAVRFLTTALPDFKVRHDAHTGGARWVHIGTETSYLALNEAPRADAPGQSGCPGVNHLGFVVDDAEGVRRRLLDAGYREGFVAPPHPHRNRVYIHDSDGFEWEFVEYFSEDLSERNDYSE